MTTSPATMSLDALVRLQKTARAAEGAVSADVRRDRLQRVIDLVVKHRDRLCAAIGGDFGNRPRSFSLMYDLTGSIAALKHARKNVAGWMKPERRRGYFPFNVLGARAFVEHCPKGVVGIMGTWNFPVYTLLAPLAYVFAAGNRAVLKPSELTPRTADLVADAVSEFFRPEELAVVNGGPEVGQAFSGQPFDHLVLTGGTHVGRAVMRNAAENLVPLTLELGGKAPVVVGRSADLEIAAERIVLAKTTNSGQLCVNADVLYVPQENLEAMLAAMRRHFDRFYPGSYAENPDWVSIISERHCQRVDDYVNEAQGLGARVETLGGTYHGPHGTRLPLRLVISPARECRIMQNEIFGPALIVLPYETIGEVIADINSRERPLALYYFGHDAREERQLLDHTISGGVTINDVAMHPGLHDAPFGGIGASGMGHYGGREGFLEFSHARTIFRAGWWDPRRALGLLPPISRKMESLAERGVSG